MSDGLFNTSQSSFSVLYRSIDIVVIGFCFVSVLYLYQVPLDTNYQLVFLISIAVFLFFSQSLELYRSWRTSSTFAMIGYTLLTWVLCCIVLITLAYFSKTGGYYSRLAIGSWFVATLLALTVWRIIFRKVLFYFRKTGIDSQTAIIIGVTTSGIKLAEQITKNPQLGIKIVGFYDDRPVKRLPEPAASLLKGDIEQGIEWVKSNKDIRHIYIAMPMNAEKRIVEILNRCSDTTATVHIIPDVFIYNLMHARWQSVGDMQTLSVFDTPFEGFNVAIKRLEDIILSLAIIYIVAIPMLIISIAIKLTSKGPAIFRQRRYGLNGQEINVYKFRSMTVDQVDHDTVIQATKNDVRVTPLGAFLRRTSLDELPQFFNVLQGSMSIVGPRPHATVHNEEYRKLVGGYMLRHKVKPGITGWAQVNGWRGETDTLNKMEKRIEYDLNYINRWSLIFDLKIIGLTIVKGFVNKNAY